MVNRPGDYEPELQGKLLALEARIRHDAFLDDVRALRRDLASASPDLRDHLLALVAPSLDAAAQDAVRQAYQLGQQDALRLLTSQRRLDTPEKVATAKSRAASSDPSAELLARVTGLDAVAADAIAKARRLATVGAEADLVLSPIFAAANTIDRALVTSINQGGNEGVTDVAFAQQVELVWIAEADACVDCLAYSGQTCGPGDVFPGGLTFAPEARFDEDLQGPPLHPNCRCTVEPLGDQSFADSLQREAERSVLRGFSLEGESMPTRIAAAQKLLASSPDAPKSVIAYAEKAVGAGAFPTRGR